MINRIFSGVLCLQLLPMGVTFLAITINLGIRNDMKDLEA